MVSENYAKSTIEGYVYGAKQLVLYTGKTFEIIESEEIYAFLVYLREQRKLSRDTMRIAACGIRYFYKHIVKRDDIVGEIPYPKKEKYLPEILSGTELKKLFTKTNNIKHRAFLKLVYSSGLRREEACSLLVTDIDSKRMLVHVRQGKGNKGRYAILSSNCLEELRNYVKIYKPDNYLFPGKTKGSRLSGNSTRWIIDRAVERANITKKVSLHTLRHSFASHLLSLGVSLPVIQQLLGHADIRTTMVYLHVQNIQQKPIISPLDIIFPAKKQST